MNTYQASAKNSLRDILVLVIESDNVAVGDKIEYNRADGQITQGHVAALIPGADKGKQYVAMAKDAKPGVKTKAALETENAALLERLNRLEAMVAKAPAASK